METGEYPVVLGGERAGSIQVRRDGIRYVFEASCPGRSGLVRLSIYGDGREGYLGVMQPGEGGLVLRRSLSRSELRNFPEKPTHAGERGERPRQAAPEPKREEAEKVTWWRRDALGLLHAEEDGRSLCAVPRSLRMARLGRELEPRWIEGVEYRIFEQ